ncbi:MAG: hypothetical protein K0U98_06585 [Deltaproteobacteria bacterium]|nr:hypothetical protein [Deltaproteobacteria bacterium]
MTEQERPNRSVPAGVVFDDQVVVIPPMSESFFSRPLWLATGTAAGQTPKWKVETGDWIERGQVVCSYSIHALSILGFDFFPRELEIRTPVDGLVIYGGYKDTSREVDWSDAQSYNKLKSQPRTGRGLFTIAVPRSSYVPETSNFAYQQFGSELMACYRPVFHSPREFRSPKRYPESDVEIALVTLLKAPLLRFPLSDYAEIVDEFWRYKIPSDTMRSLREAAGAT